MFVWTVPTRPLIPQTKRYLDSSGSQIPYRISLKTQETEKENQIESLHHTCNVYMLYSQKVTKWRSGRGDDPDTKSHDN